MSDIPSAAGSAGRSLGEAVARGVANGLRLAAAPAFATLALLAGLSDGEAVCASAHGGGGMAAMYGLMALFHLPPWLGPPNRGRRTA